MRYILRREKTIVEISEFITTQDQVGALMRHLLEETLNEKGVTPLQFITLKMLSEQDKRCKMSDLAAMRYLTPAAATGIVNKLVRQGLVERSFDAHDRRLVLLTMTKLGERVVSGVDAAGQKMMERFFQTISENDRAATIRIMKKLHEFLKIEVGSLKRKSP